jgi:pSer/pThr/pTyr-binding forkhead associated (FHA) protein
MDFTFETQGINTFLVYKLKPKDEVDQITLNMARNNRISGFAPLLFTQMNADKYLKYNISAKAPLSDFMHGTVNKKSLVGAFRSILSALCEADEYMIDASSIVLDTEYIFIDVSTFETLSICFPIKDFSNDSQDKGLFFKNIMFSVQFNQSENNDYVGKIMNYLNSNPTIFPADFKAFLDKLSGEPSIKDVSPPGKSAVQPQYTKKAQSAFVPEPQPSTPGQMPHSRPGSADRPPEPQARPVQQTPRQTPAVETSGKTSKSVLQPQHSFAIPNAPGTAQKPVQPDQNNVMPSLGDEEEMSLFYMLMHYSKENKAIYDAQKKRKTADKIPAQRRKLGGKATPPNIPPEQAASQTGNQYDFSIPGKSANPQGQSFESPKQPEPRAQQQTAYSTPVAQNDMNSGRAIPQWEDKQEKSRPSSESTPNFGGTTILGNAAKGTTVLSGPSASTSGSAYLIRTKNGERANIQGELFKIGRKGDYVDYCISDNPAVGRSHANIRVREGEYFITDTNSTNHTYINDVMLPVGVETKLVHGTKIRLGDEELVFHLN